MKIEVNIKSPNKMFIIKNRPVRSPFKTIVDENELNIIKARIKFYGIMEKDFEIKEGIKETKKTLYNPSKRQPDKKNREEKHNIIKQTKDENFNKNDIKIKQKTPKEEKENILVNQNNENLFETQNNLEQNINVDPNETEVKIETLSIKSSSILEKFLKSEF